MEAIKGKIKAHLNLAENSQVNLIEMQLLKNSYCHLLNPMSEMKQDMMAKDTEFSNESTWMLLVDQPELEARLLPVVGKRSVPITMKLKSFGTEITLMHYTSFSVKDLVAQVSELSGL